MIQSPIMQIIAATKTGKNPAFIMQQLARSDPKMAQALRLIQDKTPQQLQQMAKNVARERGIDINDVARSLGITIPSDR